ncbi:MAG: hypothetical protein ACRDTR_00530, partial [Rubrobacter sp.]
ASQTQKSLGINLNLWWGLFMVAFGCVVLGMSWASPAAAPPGVNRRRGRRQQVSGLVPGPLSAMGGRVTEPEFVRSQHRLRG